MSITTTLEAPNCPPPSPAGIALAPLGFRACLSGLMPARWADAVREYVRRQRVMYELSLLNDRELSDIRLTRQEISEIFTPEFARNRAEDGG